MINIVAFLLVVVLCAAAVAGSILAQVAAIAALLSFGAIFWLTRKFLVSKEFGLPDQESKVGKEADRYFARK